MDTGSTPSQAQQAKAYQEQAVHTLVDMDASSAKISFARNLVREVKAFEDGRIDFAELTSVYEAFATAR